MTRSRSLGRAIRRRLRMMSARLPPYLTSRWLTPAARLRLALIQVWCALPASPARDVRLRLRAGGEVWARTDTLPIDIETLDYSMGGRYFPADAAGRIVLDVGAHKGYFAMFCLDRGSRAVYSLEPQSDNFRCLQNARPARAAAGRWWRERVAVGPASGRATLQVSSESWSHSLYTPPSGNVVRTEDVPVVAFDDLLARAERENPTRQIVIKMNVEGMAGDCLLSVQPHRFARVHEIFVDIEATTPQPVEEISRHLGAAGFEARSERDGVWHFLRSQAMLTEGGKTEGT